MLFIQLYAIFLYFVLNLLVAALFLDRKALIKFL